MRINTSLTGEKELLSDLKRLGVDTLALKKSAVAAGGNAIKGLALQRAPGPHLDVDVKGTATGARANIGPDKEHWYYSFFETGAVAHAEKPGKGKLMAFEGENGEVFTTHVEHPGMPAQPFLRPAIDEGEDVAVGAVATVLRRAVR